MSIFSLFNPIGTFQTPEGKGRKGGDILNTLFNPARLGGIFDKKKVEPVATTPSPSAVVPTPEDAEKKARSEIERRRRIRALAGGDTMLTAESPLGGSEAKTLLGS